ncbi:MAG TPA: hypothetical protein ENH32_00525 [Proteobacteria bacterium]|nr:hypothetical protein [Pseudomonadota bacterium]
MVRAWALCGKIKGVLTCVFIPSLPWVAIGSKNLRQISFDLEKPLGRRDVNFEHATVRSVDPEACKVFTETDEYSYDYLVIASGHRSANESVPGLGPFDGPGHSLMSPSEAQEAREAFSAFLEKPGPVVVGCAPGASCIGPAYEFTFEIDHLLRKRRIRHKVPMTMVTPEPFLGHFGVGGMGVAVALPPVDETPVPVNFPKTGHMTQQMAAFAAHNIAAQIQGREKKNP